MLLICPVRVLSSCLSRSSSSLLTLVNSAFLEKRSATWSVIRVANGSSGSRRLSSVGASASWMARNIWRIVSWNSIWLAR